MGAREAVQNRGRPCLRFVGEFDDRHLRSVTVPMRCVDPGWTGIVSDPPDGVDGSPTGEPATIADVPVVSVRLGRIRSILAVDGARRPDPALVAAVHGPVDAFEAHSRLTRPFIGRPRPATRFMGRMPPNRGSLPQAWVIP